jgi:hypothetical protein
MRSVWRNARLVKKNEFDLGNRDSVLPAFPKIAIIPLYPGDDHVFSMH